MRELWWHLPGPRRYISEVINDLQMGINIILAFPEHFNEDVETAIRDELPHYVEWNSLNIDNKNRSPESVLYESFNIEKEFGAVYDIRDLINNERFKKKI